MERDVRSRKQIAGRDNADGINTKLPRLLGYRKNPDQLMREHLQRDSARAQNHQCIQHAVPYPTVHPHFVPPTKVVADDRDHRVVHTERRKKDKLLDLIINSIGSHRGGRKRPQDNIHSVGHKRHQSLHDDGRNADFIDLLNNGTLRRQIPQAGVKILPVRRGVKEEAQHKRYELPDNRRIRGAIHTHGRTAEPTEDHNRIKDDINDHTGHLCNRG